jgi:hypothetical protein
MAEITRRISVLPRRVHGRVGENVWRPGQFRPNIVSKSQEMVDLTMALFARYRVNGSVSEIFTLNMVT